MSRHSDICNKNFGNQIKTTSIFRPVGSTSKMDILFRNKEAIDRDISKGTSIADLCRRYKISCSTFKRFQKARQGA